MSAGAPEIRRLFEPRGVAVVGASPDPAKIGHRIVANLLAGGARCPVYPVNPKGGEILGLPVARSVAEIVSGGTADSAGRAGGSPVDVAVIAVPVGRVMEAAEDCSRAGVGFLVVVTSGYAEIGNVEGERRLVAFAREHGMRVLGPNIFGLFSAKASLNAGFGPREIRPGKVAIITQSGAMGGAMIGKTAAEGIGLSAIVPVGNKADINEADLLEYLRDDPDTEIVLIYIEGVKQGRRLVHALEATTRRKPVIVIKSGRSRRGAMAAASHTGSLAGADEVFDDLMRQVGVLRAEHLQEALAWCRFLSDAPRPAGDRAVIVTNGGGAGVAAADACEKYGIPLQDDFEMLSRAFAGVTPTLGSTKNPIDLTGQSTVVHYAEALQRALREPAIHDVIAVYCETALLEFRDLPDEVARIHGAYRAAGKPIAFCLLGGTRVNDCVARLRALGVFAFEEVYTAASCLGALHTWDRHRRAAETLVPRFEGAGLAHAALDLAAVRACLAAARAEGRHFLLAHEGHALLRTIGLRPPRGRIASGLEDAVAAAEEIGYPVVLKVVSKQIVHKSDVGGVALDLENREEVVAAYEAIVQGCRRRVPGLRIEGVEVAEMVRGGTEVIVGARCDAAFGPIVMFGLGGIYVEVLGDVAFRAVPLSRREALSMIKDTRAHRLLLGVRGEEHRDIGAVVDTLLRLAALIDAVGEITDVEINPLVVYPASQGATAVDIRVAIRGDEGPNGRP
jgi:acetyltransferase